MLGWWRSEWGSCPAAREFLFCARARQRGRGGGWKGDGPGGSAALQCGALCITIPRSTPQVKARKELKNKIRPSGADSIPDVEPAQVPTSKCRLALPLSPPPFLLHLPWSPLPLAAASPRVAPLPPVPSAAGPWPNCAGLRTRNVGRHRTRPSPRGRAPLTGLQQHGLVSAARELLLT